MNQLIGVLVFISPCKFLGKRGRGQGGERDHNWIMRDAVVRGKASAGFMDLNGRELSCCVMITGDCSRQKQGTGRILLIAVRSFGR